MNWICPKCLSTNYDSLECSCGLCINEDLLDNFREDITPSELLEEIDGHSFIGARDRVELLKYYLVKRFPGSEEAMKTDVFVDITSTSALDNYFGQHVLSAKHQNLISCPDCSATISKRAITCPHCGCPIAEIIASSPGSVSAAPSISVKPMKADAVHDVGLKCPTCHSTSIKKIGTGKKLPYVVGFGILAPAFKKVRSQFECNACGYKW